MVKVDFLSSKESFKQNKRVNICFLKEKPHKCTKCSKSFSTPGDLRGHMHSHNGTWPFRCELCNRGFTKHTNLRHHMLTHTGKYIHLTSLTNFLSFNINSSKQQKGVKPFACLKCDKQFSLACNLKSHMKTHHAG